MRSHASQAIRACKSHSVLRPHQRRYLSNTLDVATVWQRASTKPVPVTVQAIVRTIRNQKKFSFAKLGDGSTIYELQVLLSPEQAEDLSTGTTVRVQGNLQPCESARQQSHELHAEQVVVVGPANAETYPLQKKYHTPEFLRTIPHLRLRSAWHGLLGRLRSDIKYSCMDWFKNNGFVMMDPPIITSSDCEGAGEVFTVAPASHDHTGQDGDQQFFKTPKYLTVSSQLHLEAHVHSYQKVWTLSPTFRAERSDTPRHLSEFYMLEAELQTSELEEVMHVVESLLRHVASQLQNSPLASEILQYHTQSKRPNEDSDSDISGPQLAADLQSQWQALSSSDPFPRITYSEAITHLQQASSSNPNIFTHPPDWNAGLALEHERYIASTIGNNTTPVFITNYPASIKPFYMLRSTPQGQQQEATVSNFDLILPSMAELVGGSMREHNYAALLAAMKQKNVSKENLDWYLDLRKYGSVPHGGFGLGFDRLLCYLSGEGNIRDVVPWPRWVGRCDA